MGTDTSLPKSKPGMELGVRSGEEGEDIVRQPGIRSDARKAGKDLEIESGSSHREQL